MADEAGCELKVFVDTAPVMEKPLSAAAGIGWQGKHTNLLNREHGSWLFLGVIYTTLELEPDEPASDHCGSCTRCIDACPTGAIVAPRRLDARRCISYLTIEYAGPIPLEFREAIGNRIYGCDDCLAVGPWNRFASEAQANRAFAPRAELVAPAPLGDRQPAKRTHEGNGFPRRHRRIESALFREVTHLARRLERTLAAKQAAASRRGVDDPQHHSDRGGLSGAVRTEDPADAAVGDGQADPVDRALSVEILDQVPRFSGDRSFPHGSHG
jgi:epoxyqueuosine reductase QueG